MHRHLPPHGYRPALQLRQIGVRSPLVICQLLPVEQFLIWAMRAWIHQSIYLDIHAQTLRWRLTESFPMFGLAEHRRAFEQAVDVLTRSHARAVDFHELGCRCVGDDECRWLHALGALQRGARDEAIGALERFATREGATAALDLFEPLTQTLKDVGWILPPWREVDAEERAQFRPADTAPPTLTDANARPSLRLVYSRSEERPTRP